MTIRWEAIQWNQGFGSLSGLKAKLQSPLKSSEFSDSEYDTYGSKMIGWPLESGGSLPSLPGLK